jgi:transcriptional regulator with XRE-family HTH domain
MQEENSESFLRRLERLRFEKRWTWAKTAKELGISRTMIHLIRSGERKVSGRNLVRLADAETAAGLASILPQDVQRLIDAVATAQAESEVQITVADFDRGYVEVPVRYRRGTPPPQAPKKIKVMSPSAKQSVQAITNLLMDEDFSLLLATCLPAEHSDAELLEKLTPFSYMAVLEAAFAMTFGLDWQKQFREIQGGKSSLFQ